MDVQVNLNNDAVRKQMALFMSGIVTLIVNRCKGLKSGDVLDMSDIMNKLDDLGLPDFNGEDFIDEIMLACSKTD